MGKKIQNRKNKPYVFNKINKSSHSLNPDRNASKGGGQCTRDRSTIKRLLMYKNSKPKRDRNGHVVRAAPLQTSLPSGTRARVEPNRRWFGNSRVIKQDELQRFQASIAQLRREPLSVVMKPTRLPVTLLQEHAKHKRVHLLETSSFEKTFGPKAQRKRPSLTSFDMSELARDSNAKLSRFESVRDSEMGSSASASTSATAPVASSSSEKGEALEAVFRAGHNRRIWNELFKVVDSSDVVVQVLDARDPNGTRSPYLERYIRSQHAHKHLVLLINKADLVPTWVTKQWLALLSQECPTVAFHASITNPYGKAALINLLRQFSNLHSDKKQISVGLVGYPNVGKSSVVNSLRKKKVCKVAPIPGETKVWQYVSLMKRIYLIDSPGVVPPTDVSDVDSVLKSIVRVEYLKNPELYIDPVLSRVREEHVRAAYSLPADVHWNSSEEFLALLANKSGRLLKDGVADVTTVAKQVLTDWQRGKLPFFVLPPGCEPRAPSRTRVLEATATATDQCDPSSSATAQSAATRDTLDDGDAPDLQNSEHELEDLEHELNETMEGEIEEEQTEVDEDAEANNEEEESAENPSTSPRVRDVNADETDADEDEDEFKALGRLLADASPDTDTESESDSDADNVNDRSPTIKESNPKAINQTRKPLRRRPLAANAKRVSVSSSKLRNSKTFSRD